MSCFAERGSATREIPFPIKASPSANNQKEQGLGLELNVKTQWPTFRILKAEAGIEEGDTLKIKSVDFET